MEQKKHIEFLLEEARKNIYLNNEYGYNCLQEALELSKEVSDKVSFAWANLRLGSYMYSHGERVKALSQYKKAVKLFDEINDFTGICRTHYSIGTVYALISQFDLALNHYLTAEKLSAEHDPSYHTKLMNNIANTYKELQQFDRGIEICEHATRYMKKHEEDRLFMIYTTQAEIYLEKKNYNMALKYAEIALRDMQDSNELYYQSFANIIIAGSYSGLGHDDEALIVYNRALRLIEKTKNQQNNAKVNMRIAEIYLKKQEYNHAFKHLQLAMTLAIKTERVVDQLEIYYVYSKLYEALGDYKKAFSSYKKATELDKETRHNSIEERYLVHYLEQDFNRDYDEDKSEEVLISSLNQTLSELKSTYLNLSKIEKSQLTDAFVEAVVDTIDLRDSTTSGHSKRIARYSLEMMKRINEDLYVYKDVVFTETDMKEMYYASLMHDIGKLAIKEAILLKEKRLSDDRMSAVEYRFFYMKACLEIKEESSELTEYEKEILLQLDDHLEFIRSILVEYKLSDEQVKRLLDIASIEAMDCNKNNVKLLDAYEVEHLSVKRGNLVGVEWDKMKTHAKMTEMFLSEIPWLKELGNVPILASSHHEKLDGSGYPRGLAGEEITLQMRILSIVDIFEALTASDRPYKATMTIQKALDILLEEANDGKLDKKLINFFIDNEICYLCKDELESLGSKH
jgi:HD-GYP domain-containing protein (c-di-GMP phosphodiesterase class II)